jgi:DNA replication protein DnaC
MNTETMMKSLDNVLTNAFARCEYTLSELKEQNYPLNLSTTPPPFVCEFCQSEIDPCAIVLFGHVFWKNPHCGCERGLEKYQKQIAEEEARKRQEALDERARRILSNSGINNRFLSRTFDSFRRDTPEREKAYTDALYYADQFEKKFSKDGTGLYVEGTFGTGKTHLSVAIALYLIRRGVSVICKTSIDMLMDIKTAFRYDGGEEEKTARYKNCALLVIDDLGKEQCTDWSLPKLYEIINDRYEKCKPTIITTNYSHDELIRRLVSKDGDSITAGALVSRLKESAIVMNMVWSDYREGRK